MRDPIPFAGAMPWSDWLDLWRSHASLPAFRRKVENAQAIAREAVREGRLYGSLSGGKDSVALAGICDEAGVKLPWCHAHSWLNLPDTLALVDDVAERLDLPLDMIEPEDDPSRMLFALGQANRPLDVATMLDLYNRYSAGILLRTYTFEQGFDGHVDGRRADENPRTRGQLFRSRGPIWRSSVDGEWSASPLAWWSARDSFAFSLDRDLPIHPFYRRCADLGFNVERSRVDWMFGHWMEPPRRDDDTCRAVVWAYPDRWAELVRLMPRLADFDFIP